ncbi:monooxygenase [Amylibacter marinus]|uniref:Monooxygenase n=2 Tax=Amylibacter marinus TaxID=1475483 RepID=A0ABQ5VVY1_9RHOB|nr:monooxygenase [Amylibacter marinus]
MLATASATFLKLPVDLPTKAHQIVRTMVGMMLGASITMELLLSVTQWWASLLGLFVVFAAMFLVGYIALRRISGFSRASAVLCAIPGGIAEMILLAGDAGADQSRVSIVHALRIALTILAMPFLLVWMGEYDGTSTQIANQVSLSVEDWFWMSVCLVLGLVAHRYRILPASLVLVPMLISGCLHVAGITDFLVPDFVTILVQIFIGVHVGSRFQGITLATLSGALASAIVVVGVQISLACGAAILVSGVVNLDTTALMLAYAPGGLAEMSLIAVAADVESAFVGLHHLFRVLVALIAAPILIGWAKRAA